MAFWSDSSLSSLSLAIGTATSTKGLLIHTRLLSLAKESSMINPFYATCVTVRSSASSHVTAVCSGKRHALPSGHTSSIQLFKRDTDTAFSGFWFHQ